VTQESLSRDNLTSIKKRALVALFAYLNTAVTPLSGPSGHARANLTDQHILTLLT